MFLEMKINILYRIMSVGFLLRLCCFGLVLISLWPTTVWADPLPSLPVRSTVLPNGLQVILFPSEKVDRALLRLQIGVGKKDNHELATFAPFALLKKGKENYLHTAAKNQQELAISTDADKTTLSMEVPPGDVGPLVSALAEILKPQTFTDIDLRDASEQMNLYTTRKVMPKVVSEWIEKARKSGEENYPWVKPNNKSQVNQRSFGSFINDSYVPANALLFIVGKYDESSVTQVVQQTFGVIPFKKFQKKNNNSTNIQTGRDFSVKLASGKTTFSWGTKFWNIGPIDDLILNSYLEYRVMKLPFEMRSWGGIPSSIDHKVSVYPGRSGEAYLFVKSDSGLSEKDLRRVEDLLAQEVRHGKLADSEIETAIKKYTERLSYAPTDLEGLMQYVERLAWFQNTYDTPRNPIDLLREISPTAYKESLRKLFSRDQKVIKIEVSRLLFPGDRGILLLLVSILTIGLFRRQFRYTISIAAMDRLGVIGYSLLSWLLFFGGTILFLFFVALGYIILFNAENSWPLLSHAYLMRFYLQTPICVALTLFIFLRCLSEVPRQLLLTDKLCVIRCFLGRMKVIPLNQITSVSVCPHWSIWAYIPWRVRSFHFGSVFKKGILIYCSNGRGYFFAVDRPDDAVLYLNSKLSQGPPALHEIRA